MGGRGDKSGGGGGGGGGPPVEPVDPYIAIINKIALTEGDVGLRSLAGALVDADATEDQVMIQQHDMRAPEAMRSVVVAGVRVNFADVDTRTLDAIANIATMFPSVVDTLDRWTDEITLAEGQPPDKPYEIASSGTGDGRIVVYGNRKLDRITLLHEVVHNFVRSGLSGLEGIKRTLYDEAVLTEHPEPYPQGNGSLEEDFAESTALFILAPGDFKAAWPKRAAVIAQVIDWDQAD